jgi:hypothetical protein
MFFSTPTLDSLVSCENSWKFKFLIYRRYLMNRLRMKLMKIAWRGRIENFFICLRIKSQQHEIEKWRKIQSGFWVSVELINFLVQTFQSQFLWVSADQSIVSTKNTSRKLQNFIKLQNLLCMKVNQASLCILPFSTHQRLHKQPKLNYLRINSCNVYQRPSENKLWVFFRWIT